MNLIVDMGNSSSKVAVFDGDRMVYNGRLTVAPDMDIRLLAEQFSFDGCVYACVGEEQEALLAAMAESVSTVPLRVTGLTPTPLVNDYHSPETLGADRLAAAVGAFTMAEAGRPILIVDIGTCLTYDVVTADGHYLGGNISPGIGMRLRSLHEHTARLPLVTSGGDVPFVGYDTPSAIRAGVVGGIELEIAGYARRLAEEHADLQVFLTGGNGPRFASVLPDALLHPYLVETGLNRILMET